MKSFSFNWCDISIEGISLEHINPDLQIFTSEEKGRFASMKALSRKKEFYASRKLVAEHLPGNHICYTENGKPFLNGGLKSFSISHSKQYGGIAFSQKHKNIAIDIERASERIAKITGKFINNSESRYISQSELITFATIIWSAKETMYKILENGSLDFIKHYTVAPFCLEDEGEFFGTYTGSENEKTIPMKYWIKNETVIVAGHE